MSIYAVYSQSVASVLQCAVELMHYPGSQSQQWNSDRLGLAWCNTPGPEISQLGHHPQADLHAVIWGYFDRPGQQDPALEQLFRAYQRLGERCAAELGGEFCWALWDGRERKMVCSAAVYGFGHLAYTAHKEYFVFANELRLVLTGGLLQPRLDLKKIAQFAYPVSLLQENASHWQGVRGLPPAHTLVWRPGSEARTFRYWEPRILGIPPRGWQEEVQDALDESISACLGSTPRVASMLSGGLDSSAIVATACRLSGHLPVRALAGVRASRWSEVRDEWPWIQALERPGLQIDRVEAADLGPWSLVDNSLWCSETPTLTSRHYLYQAFRERCVSLSVDLLLDGCGGEIGLSYASSSILAEWLGTGQWLRLLREAYWLCQGSSRSWLSVAKETLLPYLSRVGWRPQNQQLQPGLPFRQDFLEAYIDLQELQDWVRQFIDQGATAEHRRNQRWEIDLMANGLHNPIFRRSNVKIRFPLAHRRLVELCYSAPAEWKLRHGFYRYLLRATAGRDMPGEITWRLDKMPFACDYPQRYAAQQTRLEAMLESTLDNELVQSLVDTREVVSMVARQKHSPRSWEQLHTIPSSLYMMRFLQHHQAMLKPFEPF